jgi:hypothetical protein
MLGKIAKGERPAFGIDSIKYESDTMYPANTIQLYFTSNHDENTWNKADYGIFPGDVHGPFAVFTQTMANSVPLIYSGQEEPVLRPLKFFDKDPIEFKNYQRTAFYKALLDLRKRNIALSADAAFKKVKAGNENAVYAYTREKGNKKVLVILNLSATGQTISIGDKGLWGTAFNVFKGVKEKLDGKQRQLKPWGYEVYEY